MERIHRIYQNRLGFTRLTRDGVLVLAPGLANPSLAATDLTGSELHQAAHTYQIIGLVVLIALAALVVVGIFWNRRLASENRSRVRAEQLLVRMTESLPTGVFQFKKMPDGQIVRTFMNKAARKMVRVNAQLPSAKRSRFYDFVHPDDVVAVRKTVDTSLATGNPIRTTYRYQFPGGEWGWVFAEASVHIDEEGASVWSGYFYDLTSERSLNKALNQSLISKDDFIATAGHELKTPVQGILLGLEGLEKSELNAEQKTLLGLTAGAAGNLAEQINDLLDLSRIEAHELTLAERNIDLRRLLDSTTTTFAPTARKKGLDFVCEVEESVPDFVRCDPDRLRQILSNLIANGFKYTDHGFVRIAVQVDGYSDDMPGMRDEGLFPRDSRVRSVRLRFLVQDSGIGIPDNQLEQIFQPFATVGPVNRARSGLGLAVCERLSFLMGGRISVRSKLAAGTSFELVLPVLVAAEADERTVSEPLSSRSKQFPDEPSIEPATADKEPRTILIVDDNRLARVMTSSLLSESGFAVHQAEDQTEALALYDQFSFDAIVTDYRMPESNGTELARTVRERATADKPVPTLILLTAGITDDEMATARTVFDGVLMKPVSTVQLVKTIRAMEQVNTRTV